MNPAGLRGIGKERHSRCHTRGARLPRYNAPNAGGTSVQSIVGGGCSLAVGPLARKAQADEPHLAVAGYRFTTYGAGDAEHGAITGDFADRRSAGFAQSG